MEEFISGKIDRLDRGLHQVHQHLETDSRLGTLLPFKQPAVEKNSGDDKGSKADYRFLPSAESILEEVVPASFLLKLFKCFLDAAVSEQIARMVAMKSATENAGDIIKNCRGPTTHAPVKSRITQEIMDIIAVSRP